MKKTILLGAVMLSAAAGFAQESRQDVSISGFGLIGPEVHGNAVTLDSTKTGGVLLSYRYLVTPHSALELNYSFAQNTNYFNQNGQAVSSNGGGPLFNPVHTRQQELSGAYVFGLTFKRYNPFVEAGIGGYIFTPIQEGSATLDAKQNTNIGGLFGGGLAYEISPSFDVRVQYRGVFVKAPSFVDRFRTNRYEVLSMPSIGVAYHF
jgi:opacity protein-like surface antigen